MLKEYSKAGGTIDGHYGSCKDCRWQAKKQTPGYKAAARAIAQTREEWEQERLRILRQDPRRCNKCGEEKPLTEFDNGGVSGAKRCTDCRKAYDREKTSLARSAPGARDKRNTMDRDRRLLHPLTAEQREKANAYRCEYKHKRMKDPVYRAKTLAAAREYMSKRARDPVLRAKDRASKQVNKIIRMQDPVYRKEHKDKVRAKRQERGRDATFIKILMLGSIVRDD